MLILLIFILIVLVFFFRELLGLAIAAIPFIFWYWVVTQLHVPDEYSMLVVVVAYVITLAIICFLGIKKQKRLNELKKTTESEK